MDGKVGFQKWDEVALDMLEEFKVPYGVIINFMYYSIIDLV